MSTSETPSLFQGGIRFQDGTLQTTASAGGGGGTVTHTAGNLTLNAIILGNGVADIKAGATLPADATKFYDGTGNFSTPSLPGYLPLAGGTMTGILNITSGIVLSWNADVAFSRISGGVLALGTGAQGNATGQLELGSILLSANTTSPSAIEFGTSGSSTPHIYSDRTSYIYLATGGGDYLGIQSGGAITTGMTLVGTKNTLLLSGATGADWTLTLPVDHGTSGYILRTDGAGVTSWIAPPSGSGTVNSGTAGQLAYYAASTTAVSSLGSLGTTTTVLHGNAGGAPSFGSVVESDLSLSNVTTANVSVSQHGFAPTLPNDNTQFLNGVGGYSVPGSLITATSLFTKKYYTTSQRVKSTAYQNTSGHDMLVSGWFSSNTSLITVTSDGSNPPTTVVNEMLTGSAFGADFMLVVKNNDYYEIAATGGTLENVQEFVIKSGSVSYSGDLVGSRALSTAYQNTSGNAMLVVVDIGTITSNATVIQGLSDTSNPPTTVRWSSNGTAATSHTTMWIMVPNNAYYEVTSATGAIAHWNEYSLPFAATAPTTDLTDLQSRIVNTTLATTAVYSNLTGKDVWVQAVCSNGTVSESLQTYVGANVNPAITPAAVITTLHVSTISPAGGATTVNCIAQVNDYYGMAWNAGTSTVNHWWEYKLG